MHSFFKFNDAEPTACARVTHCIIPAPTVPVYVSTRLSWWTVLFYFTLRSLYCHSAPFHHLPLSFPTCYPISSWGSLKVHLIKSKQDAGAKCSNKKVFLTPSYKRYCYLRCNTLKVIGGCGHLGDSLDFTDLTSGGCPMIAKDIKKKHLSKTRGWVHGGVDQTQTDSWLQMDVYKENDLSLLILLSSTYH